MSHMHALILAARCQNNPALVNSVYVFLYNVEWGESVGSFYIPEELEDDVCQLLSYKLVLQNRKSHYKVERQVLTLGKAEQLRKRLERTHKLDCAHVHYDQWQALNLLLQINVQKMLGTENDVDVHPVEQKLEMEQQDKAVKLKNIELKSGQEGWREEMCNFIKQQ